MWNQFGPPTCALFILLGAACDTCSGQTYKPLCMRGSSKFHAVSDTQVEVTVAPPESGGFGERTCRAELRWDKQSLEVGRPSAEIDLDLFDVELEGLGPVAAFQVKQSDTQCCTDYLIYRLSKPVRLLRTIRGGQFMGADTDLDGRVEIWAEDRAAIDGLDGLTQGEINQPPTYVLRFQHGQLLDASAAFQDHFDQIISQIRSGMSPDNLKSFQQSDGRLPMTVENLDRWRKLRATKVQVLEIVWAYLYSGREEDAWKSLRAMWPERDLRRIETLLVNARAAGILTQIDGVQKTFAARNHAQVFDGPTPALSAPIVTMGSLEESKPVTNPVRVFGKGEAKPAEPITMWRPYPSTQSSKALADQVEWLDLLIDAAGKVRSVKWTDKKTSPDEELMSYALLWKFIPAIRNGHSVASEIRFAVYQKR